MKPRFDKKLIVAALTISSLALLTGCGQSPGNPAPPPAAAPGANGIGGGCVPINTTTMISYTATNMYMGNPQTGDMRVLAGIIPPGDALASGGTTYGTMTVMPGTTTPPPQTINAGYLGSFQGQRVDGTTINLTAVSATPVTNTYPSGYGYPGYSPYGNYPANGMVNATGYINVSPFIQSLLMQTAMGSTTGFGSPIINTAPGTYPTGYPYPNVNTSQICVSNLAFSLQRTLPSYANWLYQGTVYFYLSGGVQNGQHGLALNF
jgi:hypothetical protein